MKYLFYIPIVLIISLISCDKNSIINDTFEPDIAPGENTEKDTCTVSKDFVQIDWDKTTLIKYDENENICILSQTDQSRKIKEGSIITFANDTSSYVLITESVNVVDDNIVLVTKPGSLCDIFANTTISMSTSNDNSSRGTNIINASIGKIVYYDRNDNLVSLSRSDDLGNSRLTGKLWKWRSNNEDIILLEDKNAIIRLDKPEYEANLDLELMLNFGGRDIKEILQNGTERWKSKTTKVSVSFIGNIHTKTVLLSEIFGKYDWQENDDELFIHNVFKPIYVTYYVNGIPVVARLSSDMFRGASVSVEGRLSTTIGYTNDLTCKVGMEWDQCNEKLSPISSTKYTENVIGPSIKGEGSITGKAWFFPRIYVDIDGIGCSCDVKPYVGTTVSGGFNSDVQKQNDYLASFVRGFAGMDLNCAYSQKFMNYEIVHQEISSHNLFEKDLFRTPEKIEPDVDDLSYTDIIQPREVKFKIYDYNLLLGTPLSAAIPIPVEFDTNGNLSTSLAYSDKGVVTVLWTPESQDDLLTATIYNPNGNIIDQCTVNVNLKEQEPYEQTNFFEGDIAYLTFNKNIKYNGTSGFILNVTAGWKRPKSHFDKWENFSIIFGLSDEENMPWKDSSIFELYNSDRDIYDNFTDPGKVYVSNHTLQIIPRSLTPVMHLYNDKHIAESYISAQLHYGSDIDKYDSETVQCKFVYSRKPKISLFDLKKTDSGWSWKVKFDGTLWFGPNPKYEGTDRAHHINWSCMGDNYLNDKYDYYKQPVSFSDNWVADEIITWNEEATSSNLLIHDMMPTKLYFRAFVDGKEIKSNSLHLSWNKEKHRITSISY